MYYFDMISSVLQCLKSEVENVNPHTVSLERSWTTVLDMLLLVRSLHLSGDLFPLFF